MAQLNATYHKKKVAGLCSRCRKKANQPATIGTVCLDHWFANVASNWLSTRSLWKDLKAIWEKQSGRCIFTGDELVPGVNASLDHIVPLSRGGTNSLDNVQWVLYRVNKMKGDMLESEFLDMCRKVLRT